MWLILIGSVVISVGAFFWGTRKTKAPPIPPELQEPDEDSDDEETDEGEDDEQVEPYDPNEYDDADEYYDEPAVYSVDNAKKKARRARVPVVKS